MDKTVLLVVGGFFLIYVLLKLRVSFGPVGDEVRAARQRILGAKKRARDRHQATEVRAAAWREAATTALYDLERPDLAASYALRAERLDPGDPKSVGLLSVALRRSARLRALEKLLWRRLAAHPPFSGPHDEALNQLLSLYEGPMKVGERADALRALRGSSPTQEQPTPAAPTG